MVKAWENIFSKSQLGKGDFAIVYEIWNYTLNKYVARKLYNTCSREDKKTMKREIKNATFAGEIDIGPKVLHYNINRCLIDFEILRGKTILEIASDTGELTEEQQEGLIDLINNIVDNGIHHKDFHASNIIVTDRGYKAIDFANGRINVDFNIGATPTAEKCRLLDMLLKNNSNGLLSTRKLSKEPSKLITQLGRWGGRSSQKRKR